MMWLAQHMVLWLGLSFVLGLVTSVAATVRRVNFDRWEEVPAEPEAVAPEADETPDEETTEAPQTESVVQSPFPVLEGADDPAPWEQEEQWSRAARVSQRPAAKREPSDEWEEAASNWRTWAEEAAAGHEVAAGETADASGCRGCRRPGERPDGPSGDGRRPVRPGP